MLQYDKSKVNFVFGMGLYMAPSDMRLRINKITGYNNEIIIAAAMLILSRACPTLTKTGNCKQK